MSAEERLADLRRGRRRPGRAFESRSEIIAEAKWRHNKSSGEFTRRVFAATPLRLRILIGMALLYGAFNLFRVVPVALQDRQSSSYWIILSLLPAVFYSRVRPALYL